MARPFRGVAHEELCSIGEIRTGGARWVVGIENLPGGGVLTGIETIDGRVVLIGCQDRRRDTDPLTGLSYRLNAMADLFIAMRFTG